MEVVTLEAPDISCDHCIASIRKAVTKLAGVNFLEGDPGAKVVKLEYDPAQVDLAQIKKVMEEEGYPVKEQ